jgi:hypothetical protein
VRRKIALTILGLATAASVAPLSSASAVCGPDLSWAGGPSCPSLCPAVVGRVADEVFYPGFLSCFA